MVVFIFWLEIPPCAQRWHAPEREGLVMSSWLCAVGIFGMFVAMIADQTDVDAAQKREHERLDKADQNFQEVERNREPPA